MYMFRDFMFPTYRGCFDVVHSFHATICEFGWRRNVFLDQEVPCQMLDVVEIVIPS